MSLHNLTPSELLAASCYTRGLWSPVWIWRAISSKPYRGFPVQWGLDSDLVKFHLKRATLISAALTLLSLISFLFLLVFKSPWLLLLLSLIVFGHWMLLPWAVLKFGYVKEKTAAQCARLKFHLAKSQQVRYPGKIDAAAITSLVRKDTSAALPDLGFLLREAIFSVDCTARAEATPHSDANTGITATPDAFYTAILAAVSGTEGFRAVPLAVRTSKHCQPGTPNWGAWFRPHSGQGNSASGSPEITRLVILTEEPSIDGFAAAEFIANSIGPHLSFVLRLRWMPPLSKRLHRLAFLGQQRVWWRAALVPAGLVLLALGFEWLAGKFPAIETPSAMMNLHVSLAEGVVLTLVTIFAFAPILILLLIGAYRLFRYLHGALCALTGTYLEVDAPCALRFLSARKIIEDGEELLRGVAACQVMQEVVTNCVINKLHAYGIETRSIREEVAAFINEGIYMTGGSIVADNVAVGRFSRILHNRVKIRKSRSGKSPLIASSQVT
jgi:hypothetical protein